jgi:hypothetical protein
MDLSISALRMRSDTFDGSERHISVAAHYAGAIAAAGGCAYTERLLPYFRDDTLSFEDDLSDIPGGEEVARIRERVQLLEKNARQHTAIQILLRMMRPEESLQFVEQNGYPVQVPNVPATCKDALIRAREATAPPFDALMEAARRYGFIRDLARLRGNPMVACLLPDPSEGNFNGFMSELMELDGGSVEAAQECARASFPCKGRLDARGSVGKRSRSMFLRTNLCCTVNEGAGTLDVDAVDVPEFWLKVPIDEVLSRLSADALQAELARR